jgi:hypothetical protein
MNKPAKSRVIWTIHTSALFLPFSSQCSLSSFLLCSLREISFAIAHFLMLPKVSFLTSYTAVASASTTLQHLHLAMLIAPTAASARLRDLAALGHSNQCEVTLVHVETEREAHNETSNSIIGLAAIKLVIVASDIEPAVRNEASYSR